MKLFLIFVSFFVIMGCDPERHNFAGPVTPMATQNQIQSQSETLHSHVTPIELPAQATPAACVPRYMVTVETRMHSFSLDPFKHIRNHLNANTVTFPVDKKGYDEVHVGQVLEKQFDGMGFVMKGSWGSVQSVVVDKHQDCM